MNIAPLGDKVIYSTAPGLLFVFLLCEGVWLVIGANPLDFGLAIFT
jgi:hypothetical protein